MRKNFYQPQAATPKTPELQRLLYQPQAAMPTVLLLSLLMYTVPSSDCNLIAVIADQLFLEDVAEDNFWEAYHACMSKLYERIL
jgi:hypothetical protein